MPNWKFWKQSEEPQPTPAPALDAPGEVAPRARGFVPPPPRPAAPAAAVAPGVDPERLERLLRQQATAQAAVDLAKLAGEPVNPWRERSALVLEAATLAEAELARLAAVAPKAIVPVPAIPLTGPEVRLEPQPEVEATLAGAPLRWTEPLDWAERGFQLARSDLELQGGNVPAALASGVPAGRLDDLAADTEAALFRWATAARDATLAGQQVTTARALTDLLEGCPACGGWRGTDGACRTCSARAAERDRLESEIARFRAEATAEENDRAKAADGLQVAQRRLAAVDAEIVALRGGG